MELYNCYSHSANYTTSCLPNPTAPDFNIPPIIDNVRNGICPELMWNVFTSCTASTFSYLFNLDPNCYANRTQFETCLPGYSAKYTKNPNECYWLSHLVFIFNEVSTFLSGPKKALAIAAANFVRNQEINHCLISCSDEKPLFLGDREFEHETSRYAMGLASRAIKPIVGGAQGFLLGGPAGGLFGLGLTWITEGKLNTVNQVLAGPVQQAARNQDFEAAYKSCGLPEPKEPTQSYGLRGASLQKLNQPKESRVMKVAQDIFWGVLNIIPATLRFVGSTLWSIGSVAFQVIYYSSYTLFAIGRGGVRVIQGTYHYVFDGEQLDFSQVFEMPGNAKKISSSHSAQKTKEAILGGEAHNEPSEVDSNSPDAQSGFSITQQAQEFVENIYAYIDGGGVSSS